ncbi:MULTISPECIES: DASS family sodium-coupled anion symporter [unclassified Actinomyces]|uniref:SLC13 family permease n=1 Tax=unclassified Actinomyces TaxID=2609248 RepID=UPI0020175683|nr:MULTISPECIES: DASS family sodium-coupled anion symporter [unclassified Actinomyces]MCL3778060.1 DASS family sodium-coupled anion symporter [Actinomyces sp. AC-20-1]MCL3789854.1 DASS family sodium-coupled anion symporter [Actinomyces sp. 187325]MCL3792009.1 DASS family sodium-coupled anion symporter [Actinomyces sp. 186855]MCL3794711.1 DASS family sodium-coupled anion symporter [Actinomyces sp. 217892]
MSVPHTLTSSSKAPAVSEGLADRTTVRRRLIGVLVGLALAALAYYLFPASGAEQVNEVGRSAAEAAGKTYTDVTDTGLRTVAAAAILMGAWWMTEAIPLAATALLPLVLFPAMQVATFKETAAPYASETIWLFMGGFMLALAMQRWNLHRRIALAVVLMVGTKPRQLILGFMIATGFLSMWVSNTATAVVMLPIGMSVLTLVSDLVGGIDKVKRFATALMLGIAYAASIGSVATVIGTPPNALLVAYLSESHGIHIGFGQWMILGAPLAVTLMAFAWWLMAFVLFKPEVKEIPGGREFISQQWKELGGVSRGEALMGTIFVLTASSWVLIPILLDKTGSELRIPDALIAMVCAALLFLIPADSEGRRLLDWKSANELPWDVLLLFGGGLSLSSMFDKLGLSVWIGEQAKGLGTLPIVVIVATVATLIIFLTELTSNTATAAAFLPIMGGVATGIGITSDNPMNVLLLVVPVALAATFAFMLPVATPPNAVAYGSGYITMGDMVRTGIWLNLVGIVLITLAVLTIGVPVFGLTF